MPLYFIDVQRADTSCPDRCGVELDDLQAARDAAISLLPDLARDELATQNIRFLASTVRDETGRPLFRATLSVTAEWLDRAGCSSGPQDADIFT